MLDSFHQLLGKSQHHTHGQASALKAFLDELPEVTSLQVLKGEENLLRVELIMEDIVELDDFGVVESSECVNLSK